MSTNHALWSYRYRTADRATAKADSYARQAMLHGRNRTMYAIQGDSYRAEVSSRCATDCYGQYLAYRELAYDIYATM
jgi:hypothetical protein